MGPRIFIRGYVVSMACVPRPPRFNGAADFHPRIRNPVSDNAWAHNASMGPRIFIRGYRPFLQERKRRGDASMGPRIFIRGYMPPAAWTTRPTSFNGAADFHPRILGDGTAPGPGGMLQWGRGFSSADTAARARALWRRGGFNGAADFHPRIHQRPQQGPSQQRASMGPRIFIRGYQKFRDLAA